MAAWVVRDEPDDLVRLCERLLRRLRVARLPVVDAVVGLPFLVVADDGRAVLERRLRRRHDRQRLVVDVDQLERVVRDVRVLRDHARDLLALHAHLVGREHGLRVAGERRHPRELVLGEHIAGDDHDDARQLHRAGRVDRVDLGMRVRTAQDRHVQHPGQLDVLDVVAPADDEARVLLALDAPPQPALVLGLDRGHDVSSLAFGSVARGKPCFPREPPSSGMFASTPAPLRSPRASKRASGETSRFPPSPSTRPLTRSPSSSWRPTAPT